MENQENQNLNISQKDKIDINEILVNLSVKHNIDYETTKNVCMHPFKMLERKITFLENFLMKFKYIGEIYFRSSRGTRSKTTYSKYRTNKDGMEHWVVDNKKNETI